MRKIVRFDDHLKRQLEEEGFASLWFEQDPAFQAGDLLLKLRMQHGLTQAQLAERVGLKRPYISRLESGEANPTIRTLGRILGAFDLALVLDAQPRESSGSGNGCESIPSCAERSLEASAAERAGAVPKGWLTVAPEPDR